MIYTFLQWLITARGGDIAPLAGIVLGLLVFVAIAGDTFTRKT
jgi:hypothetical protein